MFLTDTQRQITVATFKMLLFVSASSAHAGDLAIQADHYAELSDEEDSLDDSTSLGAVSESSSMGSTGRHSHRLDEVSAYNSPFYTAGLSLLKPILSPMDRQTFFSAFSMTTVC